MTAALLQRVQGVDKTSDDDVEAHDEAVEGDVDFCDQRTEDGENTNDRGENRTEGLLTRTLSDLLKKYRSVWTHRDDAAKDISDRGVCLALPERTNFSLSTGLLKRSNELADERLSENLVGRGVRGDSLWDFISHIMIVIET